MYTMLHTFAEQGTYQHMFVSLCAYIGLYLHIYIYICFRLVVYPKMVFLKRIKYRNSEIENKSVPWATQAV